MDEEDIDKTLEEPIKFLIPVSMHNIPRHNNTKKSRYKTSNLNLNAPRKP